MFSSKVNRRSNLAASGEMYRICTRIMLNGRVAKWGGVTVLMHQLRKLLGSHTADDSLAVVKNVSAKVNPRRNLATSGEIDRNLYRISFKWTRS